jgi:hypothetical protein
MGAALSVTPFRRLKLRPVRMPRAEFHPTPRSVIDMARAMAAALAGCQFGTAAEAVSLLRSAFPDSPLNVRVAALGMLMETAHQPVEP